VRRLDRLRDRESRVLYLLAVREDVEAGRDRTLVVLANAAVMINRFRS
jgi:hypothetical protein